MKTKKILMFDFDGVLADTFELTYQNNKKAHCPTLTRKMMRQVMEGNFYKAAKWFRPDKIKDFLSLYSAQVASISPYRGIAKELQILHKDHILAVITSNSGKVVKNYLKKYHLAKYFRQILGQESSKSKTVKINHLISKYHTSTSRCLFITDTLGDILEAKECGVQSIAVTGGFHSERTLRKGKPARIVKDTKHLAKAIYQYFK